MTRTYNDAIELCKKEPTGAKASENPTICGIQNIIEQPVANRLKLKPFLIRGEDDDEDEASMAQIMCGCRLTAKVLFVMITLKIFEPIGQKFIEEYKNLFETSNIVNTIMGKGLNESKISEIKRGEVSGVSLDLTSSDLFIVQILKYIDWMDTYSPVHSFIINKNSGHCQVLSSWYAGGDTEATPIISNILSCDELNERLQPENLLDNDNTDFLFGPRNNLNGKLVIIFISADAIIPKTDGGRKGKKRKTMRKKKCRSRRKH